MSKNVKVRWGKIRRTEQRKMIKSRIERENQEGVREGNRERNMYGNL